MRFKVDENLPVELAEILRSANYDAATVTDENLTGKGDRRLAEVCQKEGRILVTLDVDFSDVRTYPPQQYLGLMVFRVRQQDRQRLTALLRKVIPLLETEEIERRLWIVEEHRVRIRGED